MRTAERSIFAELFDYRPTMGMTPKENFLTQGFAHILQRYPALGKEWLAHVAGVPVESLTGRLRVTPQAHLRDSLRGDAYIDLMLRCRQGGGAEVVVFSEHKWDSRTDKEQLQDYRERLAEVRAETKKLIFIGKTKEQGIRARRFCDARFTWEEVYATLIGRAEGRPLAREFLAFLREQELGDTIFTPAQLAAGGESVRMTARKMAKRLATLEWEAIPRRWRKPVVVNHYGRHGLMFGGDWKPYIFAGIQTWDPALGFRPCTQDKGADLMLAVGVDHPSRAFASRAIDLRVRALRAQRCVVLGPNDRDTYYLKVIVRQPLADVIRDCRTAEEQVARMHARLQEWGRCFFATDGVVRAIAQVFR